MRLKWVKSRIESEEFFPYRLRAAYTVEAAAVMGTCMIFIGLLFMGGINLYASAMETLSVYERTQMRQQDIFRISHAIYDVVTGSPADEEDAGC